MKWWLYTNKYSLSNILLKYKVLVVLRICNERRKYYVNIHSKYKTEYVLFVLSEFCLVSLWIKDA